MRGRLPKITDFGLAKKLDGASGQTQAGEVIGTPSYMSPEQAEGRPDIGPGADIWALGAILYECLTGRPPFATGSVLDTLEQVRRHDPPAPRSLCPDVPRDLETICLKCLEKSPARRYHTAADLGADLGHFLAREPIRARPVGLAERSLKWARRRPGAAVLAGACVLLAGLLAIGAPLHIRRLQAHVEEAREEMGRAHEKSRRAELRRTLAEGEAALARGKPRDVEHALGCFTAVVEGISTADASGDPELQQLRDEANRLKRQAGADLERLLAAGPARERAKRFLALRDEAFFHLHNDLIEFHGPARPQVSIDACRRALELFPELHCLACEKEEWKRLLLAQQEVLLLLAEATARRDNAGPARLREALLLLDQAEEADAPRHTLHLRRARYLGLLGDSSGAERERQLAEQTPLSGALDWFLRGQERWLASQERAALEDMEHALSAEPDLFWPRLLRAVGLQRLGERTEARAELGICIGKRPDFPWPYLMRASLHIQAGHHAAAATDLADVSRLRLDTSSRYALFVNQGVLALARGNPRAAASEFQRAIFLCPGLHHAHVNLAQVFWKTGNRPRALGLLDHALHLQPLRPELYRTRSLLLIDQGQFAPALRDLDRALALEPADRPSAARNADLRERARLLYHARRYSEALPACRQALECNPADTAALRLHAEVLLELGKHREAVAAFDRYLKTGRRDVDVYRRRARARAGVGDLAGVVEDCTLALSLEQKPSLFTARGWAQLVNGAPRLALRDFESALARAPGDADALIGRGSAQLEQGEVKLAIADIEKGLAGRPRSARVLSNAARGLARAATIMGTNRLPRQVKDLERRTLEVLRLTLEAVPAADRPRFFREQIRPDDAFRSPGLQRGLEALEKQTTNSGS